MLDRSAVRIIDAIQIVILMYDDISLNTMMTSTSLCQQKELKSIPAYNHGTLTPLIGAVRYLSAEP